MTAAFAHDPSPGVLPESSAEGMVETGSDDQEGLFTMEPSNPIDSPDDIVDVSFVLVTPPQKVHWRPTAISPVAEPGPEYDDVLDRLYLGELFPATIETLVGYGDDLSDLP